MNDYLSKPLDPQVLLEILKKWLPKKKTMHQDAAIAKTTDIDPPEATIFDREGLLARVMGDETLAAVLTNTFLDDIPNQIDTLRQQLETGNCAAATRTAHTIKGAAANVGAIVLSRSAADMEKAGKEAALDNMKHILPKLEKQFSLTEQEIGRAHV